VSFGSLYRAREFVSAALTDAVAFYIILSISLCTCSLPENWHFKRNKYDKCSHFRI